ncbi:MAG: endo-1,4-beta-xylanase [Ruminococcus flavefaciens]
MRKGNLKKSVAGALAGLMCALSVPAIPTAVYNTAYAAQTFTVGGGQTQHKDDNVDGYSYEIWLDRTGGSGSMTLGSGGAFDAQWSAEVSQGNFLARRGKNYDRTKKATDCGTIVMDYAAQYSASAKGNSRLCVYGWFVDPLVEYYIIEDWVNWCPSGSGKTVTIDGAQYDIFQTPHTGPTILGDTRTFQQYFSVRKQKRTSGTITVSDHFKAWANAGMQIGNLTEVALNVEGWESSGRANVTKLTISDKNPNPTTTGGSTPVTTTPVQTVKADSNGYYFNESFESGAGDWEGRGAAKVSKDTANYAEGKSSLYVSGRTDNWNGAAIQLDSSAFVAGNTYSFGAAVMQNTESSTAMKMTLQYTDADGKEQYDEVATATASNGKWTALSNPSYTIPSGATGLLLYIEAPDSLTDFYVDSAMAGVKGKEVTVSGGTSQTPTVTTNGGGSTTTTPTTASQGTGLKGKFAPWFKIGTSVSPGELNSGASFLKENYNSITPENELKPESILDQNASRQSGSVQVNLSRAASTLKFCEDNGISLRGHTFVWYSQTPDWFFKENFSDNGNFVSKSEMNKRLEDFIKNTFEAIAKQYPKLDLYSYDVCNELFLNDGGGLRKTYYTENSGASNWAKVYGEDNDEFIINAFKYARQYAPKGCKLYLNDYNEYVPAKTNDIYNMAMKLKELGYIDGIGMQSHLDTGYPDAKTYETALKKFLSTGLEVQITELDITCKDFSAQADLYEKIVGLAMDHADQIPALTIWGTTDNVSWRSSQNPLLFSQGYKPKPAYDKVVALASSKPAPTPTGGNTTTNAPTSQTPTTTTSATPASSSANVTLWGDANVDGTVDMSDAVIIMQSLSNPSKYSLKAQGSANGDVNLSGNGISNADALAIQKYLVGIIDKLPESYSEQSTPAPSVTSTKQQTNAPATTTQAPAASNKTYISADFGSSSNSFESRGGASVELNKGTYYSAPSSLYVTGRTDNWHGASIALGSDFVPGNTYSFSAAVLQTSGSADTVKMTLQYKDAEGTEQYDEVASVKADDKTWTDLTNTKYTIPAGATDLLLYVEMPDSLADFFVDDVTVAASGTASKIKTGGGTVGQITTTTTPAPTVVTPTTPTESNLDPSKPMIAISFDDGAVGSSPTASSMRIINAIADQGFHATFFYVGSWTQQKGNSGAEEIKYAYQKGMEIANHTWTHPQNLPSMSSPEIRSEVDKTANLLEQITGAKSSKLLRLPYLNNGPAVQSTLSDYGLVSCAIDTGDWNNASKDQIVNKVKSAMADGSANGAVVLCHETYDTTAAAIEELAPYIKAQGWQIATMSEMYAAKGKSIPGGQLITRVY